VTFQCRPGPSPSPSNLGAFDLDLLIRRRLIDDVLAVGTCRRAAGRSARDRTPAWTVMTSPAGRCARAAEIVLNGLDAEPLFWSSPLTDTWNSLAEARSGVTATSRSVVRCFIVKMDRALGFNGPAD